MPKHQTTNCPRCDVEFECKMGSIVLCHCSEVVLNEAQREFIAERWNDCLCQTCLLEISRMESITPG